ncbi:MAG: alpha-L-rhamnosidase C-terminal domain-containing protein [Paludibacter sp.]
MADNPQQLNDISAFFIASIFSPKGKIDSEWKKTRSNNLELKTLIPINITAKVYIPFQSAG